MVLYLYATILLTLHELLAGSVQFALSRFGVLESKARVYWVAHVWVAYKNVAIAHCLVRLRYHFSLNSLLSFFLSFSLAKSIRLFFVAVLLFVSITRFVTHVHSLTKSFYVNLNRTNIITFVVTSTLQQLNVFGFHFHLCLNLCLFNRCRQSRRLWLWLWLRHGIINANFVAFNSIFPLKGEPTHVLANTTHSFAISSIQSSVDCIITLNSIM